MRVTLWAPLDNLTLSRRWSALGHCGMDSQHPQVFPYSHYLLSVNREKKGGWRLETPAHCVDRTRDTASRGRVPTVG